VAVAVGGKEREEKKSGNASSPDLAGERRRPERARAG
jgi:hypothetical protein